MATTSKAGKLVWTKTATGAWTQVPAAQAAAMKAGAARPAPAAPAAAPVRESLNDWMRVALRGTPYDHPLCGALAAALHA